MIVCYNVQKKLSESKGNRAKSCNNSELCIYLYYVNAKLYSVNEYHEFISRKKITLLFYLSGSYSSSCTVRKVLADFASCD